MRSRLRVSAGLARNAAVWMFGASVERPWGLAVVLGVYLGPWAWTVAIERYAPPPATVASTTDPDALLRQAFGELS